MVEPLSTMLLNLVHLHIVKYLIDQQGCNPSCLDDYGYTPLHCATVKEHIDIVKFFTVEKGCSHLIPSTIKQDMYEEEERALPSISVSRFTCGYQSLVKLSIVYCIVCRMRHRWLL